MDTFPAALGLSPKQVETAIWLALAAWAATFTALLWHLHRMRSSSPADS